MVYMHNTTIELRHCGYYYYYLFKLVFHSLSMAHFFSSLLFIRDDVTHLRLTFLFWSRAQRDSSSYSLILINFCLKILLLLCICSGCVSLTLLSVKQTGGGLDLLRTSRLPIFLTRLLMSGLYLRKICTCTHTRAHTQAQAHAHAQAQAHLEWQVVLCIMLLLHIVQSSLRKIYAPILFIPSIKYIVIFPKYTI